MHFKFFPAFFDHPVKMRFADQETDEYIELLLRQHWVTTISWIISALFLATVPPVLLKISSVQVFLNQFHIPNNIMVSVFILWYMFITAYVIGKFLYWYFNIYIVTNMHLVDVSYQNLLSKSVTEIFLSDIQSSRVHLRGVLGSLFNFGDVIIETEAKKQDIQFLSVPKPDAVKERIQDLQEVEKGLHH